MSQFWIMKKVFLYITCSKVSWETTQRNLTITPFTIGFISIAPRLVPRWNRSSSTTTISLLDFTFFQSIWPMMLSYQIICESYPAMITSNSLETSILVFYSFITICFSRISPWGTLLPIMCLRRVFK